MAMPDLAGALNRIVTAVRRAVAPVAVVQMPAPPVSAALSATGFDACLAVVLASEGGFVVDQGGPTNLGVTQRTLSAFYGRAASVDEVRTLTPASVAPLYRQMFFNAAHCDELPAGVDLMVFDEAVNEGPGRAIRHLQQSVGVAVDGLLGPGTLAAVKSADPIGLINSLRATNAAYYQSLGGIYPQDLSGWLARNQRTYEAALRMAGA